MRSLFKENSEIQIKPEILLETDRDYHYKRYIRNIGKSLQKPRNSKVQKVEMIEQNYTINNIEDIDIFDDDVATPRVPYQ